jgi:transcriptional regulator with XRE-family HTH domain
MSYILKFSLRSARINAGLTRKEAAERLLIGTSTLRGYEVEGRIPRWDIVMRIQKVYGISYENIDFGKAG